jgi:probable rRNA maturation factor
MELTVDFSVRCRREKATAELRELVRRAIAETLACEKVRRDCAVSVTFVSDRIMRGLNREYRGKDSATDVLSFPQAEPGHLDSAFDGRRLQLGDIVISLERARAQAELYGHTFEREVAFLTVHSVLHLLGYDHETGPEDELRMRRRQRAVMKRLGAVAVAPEK